MIKRLFLLVLIISLPSFKINNNYDTKIPKHAINATHLYQAKGTYLYEVVVSYIKKHEGFSNVRYMDGKNVAIGYGCHVKYHGVIPDTITQLQADSILRVSFNGNLTYIKSHFKVSYNKQLALAHLSYAKGIKFVLDNNIDSIFMLKDSLRVFEAKLYYLNN